MFEPILDIDDVRWSKVLYYWDFNQSGVGTYKGQKCLINVVQDTQFPKGPDVELISTLPTVWRISEFNQEVLDSYGKGDWEYTWKIWNKLPVIGYVEEHYNDDLDNPYVNNSNDSERSFSKERDGRN